MFWEIRFHEIGCVEHKKEAGRPTVHTSDDIANVSQQMENNGSLFNKFVCKLGPFWH
jgi:hypothetical protein